MDAAACAAPPATRLRPGFLLREGVKTMRQITPDLRKPQYVRKGEQIKDLRDKLQRANSAVLVEYRGMTVKETTELRNRLRKLNAEMDVAKNTLIKRAMEDAALTGLDTYLEGPTAVVFAFEDAVPVVKVLNDYTKESRFLVLKAGRVEGRVYEAAQLGDIARMPPREQIIGTLLGALQGPAANLVGMLQAPASQLVFTLQAIGEKSEAAPAEG
jgi:large subunit ribosomal protein L10